ncbi:MAG: hypothetical protein DRP11_02295 [Candidatus Aenigmatarchaeota archaeon]|nr:MAG: hypothetical protein DRP11_02295 [Candidatus Aenigmarchaeota archaeon]
MRVKKAVGIIKKYEDDTEYWLGFKDDHLKLPTVVFNDGGSEEELWEMAMEALEKELKEYGIDVKSVEKYRNPAHPLINIKKGLPLSIKDETYFFLEVVEYEGDPVKGEWIPREEFKNL